MRGEEALVPRFKFFGEELPPHARRRAVCPGVVTVMEGITSACAEKRPWHPHAESHQGNYLRMRGEELGVVSPAIAHEELPPHARRRATRINPDTHP